MQLLLSFIVSCVASFAIAENIDTSPLYTALITFGVSFITMIGGELIKFIVTFFKAKTKKYKEQLTEEELKEDNSIKIKNDDNEGGK